MIKITEHQKNLYGGDNKPMPHYWFTTEDGTYHGEVLTIDSDGDIAEQWLEIHGNIVAYEDELLDKSKREALKKKYPDAGFLSIVDEEFIS